MNISKMIKGNFLAVVADMAAKKVDAEEFGQLLDKEGDELMGEKPSEKVQRKTLTPLFYGLLKGLWSEDKLALAAEHRAQAEAIEKEMLL